MKAQTSSRWDFEVRALAWLAIFVSVFSFLFYFRSGDILLYGDAEAHINIARRVFDSKTPGLLQLGTVWLPLPHLLMIPFLVSDKLWQSGVGGSLPSLVAYVFAVIGIFRLVRGSLSRQGEGNTGAHVAAWIAAGIYGANPNLIYMQATAMGESLYLAFFIWSVVYFSEFVRGEENALTKCGLCVPAACLTRYDGWLLAIVMIVGALVEAQFYRRQRGKVAVPGMSHVPKPKLLKFIFLAVAGPALWLAYNAAVYRNPLEFANGPYSAKAIENRMQHSGAAGHPGAGNVCVAGLYFMKAAESNMAENPWLQRLWVLLTVCAIAAGFLVSLRKKPETGPPSGVSIRLWPLLLLSLPLPFYALSVAYGSVPIFVPEWWPSAHYNVRYGLQLLPAFAVGAGVIVAWVWDAAGRVTSGTASSKRDTRRSQPLSRRGGGADALSAPRASRAALDRTAEGGRSYMSYVRPAIVIALLALTVASYASAWQAGPICLREAQINMRGHIALETQVGKWLDGLPSESTLLMYLGGYPGALERAGIPLKRVINEGNHRVWKRPQDPQGLWERALANPAKLTDYAVAFEGDPVWQAVHGLHLKELVEIQVSGQPRAIIYQTR